MKKLLPIIILFLFAVPASAQQSDTGEVKVVGSSLLDLKIKNRVEERDESEGMDGFRIQVYFGDDRKEATELKEKLEKIFPDFACYLIIELPYYKVRIGNFRTRVEAQALFFALQHIFPDVFIVQDKIEWPAINEPEQPIPSDYEDYRLD